MNKKPENVMYACPICNNVYKTKKEAVNCAKNIKDYFEEGDIIHFHGDTWRISYLRDGMALDRVNDYRTAFDYKRRQMKSAFYGRTKFCDDDIEKIDIRMIICLKNNLKTRYLAACRLEKVLTENAARNKKVK